jgi:hypothetical protein
VNHETTHNKKDYVFQNLASARLDPLCTSIPPRHSMGFASNKRKEKKSKNHMCDAFAIKEKGK